jgi:hypothetical protein
MSVKQPRTRRFMAHEPGFTIIDAMNRLFPAWFDGESCGPGVPAGARSSLRPLAFGGSCLRKARTPSAPRDQEVLAGESTGTPFLAPVPERSYSND